MSQDAMSRPPDLGLAEIYPQECCAPDRPGFDLL